MDSSINKLLDDLEKVVALGRSTHHGRGYTLAGMVAQAIKEYKETKSEEPANDNQ